MNLRPPFVAPVLLCLIILAGTDVSTHQGPPKPDAAPTSPSRHGASQSIVFERQYMGLRFESDGKSRRELTMHVRVSDDAGVRGAGQIPLVYAPSSDDLEITRLEIQKADGRTITVGSDAVQDHAIQPGATTPAFVDLRQKTVTVPALQPGDLIVITAVWNVARPFAGKHSWFEHSFVKHAVVLDERLELDVPAGLQPGLGFAYQRLKRYDEAIEVLEKHRSLDPSNKSINSTLGFVYKEAKRLEDAAKAYARHLTIEPLDGPTHKILGGIYGDLERHTEAIASLEKASLLVKPPDPWVHKQLGDSHLALKKRTEALEAFDRALALSKSPELLTGIAWTLADEGVEADRVLDLSGRGIAAIGAAMSRVSAEDVKPEHFRLMERLAWAWDARGLVALGKGDASTALKYFTSAWQLAGRAVVSFHLGQAYQKQHRLADAASAYLTSRAMDPDPDAALQAKMKEFYPSGDMKLMMKSALDVAVQERAVPFASTSAQVVRANFNAILNGSGRVVDLAFIDGAQELVSKDAVLRTLKFPLESPSPGDVRMAVRLNVGCDPKGCHAFMKFPRNDD